ncbi:MAG TPA: twin-arginine translocase subunit TatC [Flavobacteriales bacterium]|nr:twin-arginine translocase subunit TatC [Flavobacteriales bacterium]
MTFLEHLEELRWTLVRSAIAVMVGFVLCFIYKSFVFEEVVLAAQDPHFITYRAFCKLGLWMGMPDMCIDDLGFTIQNLQVSGQFMMHMSVALVAGIILAFPYILWELWRFIGPGLRERERQGVRGFVAAASMLFFIGVLFGYYLLTPLTVQFFGNYQVSPTVANKFALESFIGIVTQVTLWTGIIFELPLLVVILTRIGVLGPAFLRTYRKHSYVGILVVAAILTPPDVISQILVSAPLILLYEGSIVLSARAVKRMEAAHNTKLAGAK